MNPALRIISTGWGVQTWTLKAMAVFRNCGCDVCKRFGVNKLEKVDFAIHGDTTFEREETYQFIKDWTPWLQDRELPVIEVTDERATFITKDSKNGGYYTIMPIFTLNDEGETIWIDARQRIWTFEDFRDEEERGNSFDTLELLHGPFRQFKISRIKKGQLRRQCTSRWKIEPIHKWLTAELKARAIQKSDGVIEQWLGISLDEWERVKDSKVDWIVNHYPLLEMKMTRNDCIFWLTAHNLPSPGKSACKQCPYHSRQYWQQMKRENGKNWQDAVQYDNELRRDGRQWFLHSDRKPLAEAVVLPEENGQRSLFEFDNDNNPTCDSGHCFL